LVCVYGTPRLVSNRIGELKNSGVDAYQTFLIRPTTIIIVSKNLTLIWNDARDHLVNIYVVDKIHHRNVALVILHLVTFSFTLAEV